ncbi:MAG: transglutaminase domain-containing protein, partial [Bacteroidota bacterium]
MIRTINFFVVTVAIFTLFVAESYGQISAAEKKKAAEASGHVPGNFKGQVPELAALLTSDLNSKQAKAYAIYHWIAHNISYDYAVAENVEMGAKKVDVISEALEKRKGVCQHYAELFHALATESGLTSVLVYGYTKQDGKIMKVPHTWNALQLDAVWYLFDPTWGAGYLYGSTYHKHFTEEYFMMEPERIIRSHMPFDLLFQFTEYSVGHEEFKRGKPSDSTVFVNYRTEMRRYLEMNEEEQLPEAMDRVEKLGIANTMVRGYYSFLNRQHRVYLANRQIDLHNHAVDMFNEVVQDYNRYVNVMNAQ